MESGIIQLNNLKDLSRLPKNQQKSARRQLLWLKRHFPKCSLVECRTPNITFTHTGCSLGGDYSVTFGTVIGYIYRVIDGQALLSVLKEGTITNKPVNLIKNIQRPYDKL